MTNKPLDCVGTDGDVGKADYVEQAEQARIIGKSAEREAMLLGRIERLRHALLKCSRSPWKDTAEIARKALEDELF